MSRLYIVHDSDLRSGKGHCASEKASVAIYWGSANDSKLAARISVSWLKSEKKPVVVISTTLPREADIYAE